MKGGGLTVTGRAAHTRPVPHYSMKDCQCLACTALANRYEGDPALLAFYRKKLLVRGWAGDTDAIEKAYINAHATWIQPVTATFQAARLASLQRINAERRAAKERAQGGDSHGLLVEQRG